MLKGRVLLLVLLLFALLICSRPTSSHEPVTTRVRFNKEVIRIFRDHCIACHRITEIALDSYANARPWAKAFKEEILERRMPPFQTVKGFGNFANDYQLTQHEIDQIVSWVDGGTPKGDDKDLPATSQPVEPGTPDLVLSASQGEGSNYRCVALPTNLKQRSWVSAIKFVPGDETALHCASISFANNSRDCDQAPIQYAWFPGQTASVLPKGIGRPLPAGSYVLLKLHYGKNKPVNEETGSIELYFTKDKHPNSLQTVSLVASEVELPPDAQDVRVESSYTVGTHAEAIAIRPLLFPFARSVEVSALRPDGTSEVLIWAADYRYDWQPEFRFKHAISLPKGTRIRTIAHLDNSSSNPNNPNSPARGVRFDGPLCELSFVNTKARGH